MSNSPYHQLDRLIDEYEEVSRLIKADTIIMVNYAKVFLMTAASTFEHIIKQRCQDFINFPLIPISSYANLYSLIQYCNRKNIIVVDSMFGKFHTQNRTTGLVNLDATNFYNLFGGGVFKNSIEIIFNIELNNRITKFQDVVDNLSPLIGKSEQFNCAYVKNDDILERLKRCTFSISETAFLNLKLKRNQVAHNYINGLSDSFNDISNFYFDALIYVMALDAAIENLTNVALINPPL